jgi:hypothetical protein
MKYSWPAVVNELRNIMLKNTSFKCATKQQEKDMQDYFRIMMFETDTFHPWNSDGMLSRALDKLPQRCDYRHVENYWKWKEGRLEVEEALECVFQEMEDTITEWFGNWMNHPPGYVAPEVSMKRNYYNLATVYAGRIIGVGKRGV